MKQRCYNLFLRVSMLIFFFLEVPHLFWRIEGLFIGIEFKLAIKHNFLLVRKSVRLFFRIDQTILELVRPF